MARWVPSPNVLLTICVASLVLAVTAFGTIEFLRSDEAVPSGKTAVPAEYAGRAFGVDEDGILDTDLDGLPDAVETFVYGTDPFNWSTAKSGIPDSWLIEYGYDPLDPAAASLPAAAPPSSSLPAGYRGRWPEQFRASLLEIYGFNRPANYDEETSGPYTGGLEPTTWDTNGDTIPDGWALFYGLDPYANISTNRLAGDQGFSVLEAFRYNTDPRALDTDADGLTDRQEVEGAVNPRFPNGPQRFPPTDPSAYSTAGSSVCDGYLVAFGLDPNEPENGYADLAHSGATTLEKFQWSLTRFKQETCTEGRGLDPTRGSTLNGPIPDGWLMRYALDPLDPSKPNATTQSTAGPGLRGEAPDKPPLEEVALTVFLEYAYGRPTSWKESEAGPWGNGTDPTKADTDADGIDDAVEIRGYYVNWSTEIGPNPNQEFTKTVSDPTRADSDDDGLTDRVELVDHGTDPSRDDTDSDGITDRDEVESPHDLDPRLADTPGDFLRDGTRFDLLQKRSEQYFADSTYEFPGQPGQTRSVATWLETTRGAADLPRPLSREAIRDLVAPGGDLDGDGTPNILDADIDGDGLLNGWEVDPTLFRHSRFGEGRIERPESDPFNADTDGDGLMDGWEVEHGQPIFTMAPPRYSLDPHRWDSDGDGVGDGEEDPDEDSLDWILFEPRGATAEPVPQRFVFPNLLEQQFQTDPSMFSTDGDGLGDGWKVFWGLIFPAPASAAIRPAVGVPQADVIVSTHVLRRYVLDPSSIQPFEQVTGTFPNVPIPQGGQRTVYEVTATIPWGFRQIHDAGTNPYVLDTSLDGVPDWWATLFGALPPDMPAASECVAEPTRPLVHYGNEDVDGDGLTVLGEFENSANPRCADSDLDGLADGEEVGLGLDPADPEDGRNILEGTVDSDADGLFDFRELVGTRRTHLGSALIRTDPRHPDTDGDGLLDGADQPSSGALSESDAITKLLLDLGISYTQSSNAGARSYTFRGEDTLLADPRATDDAGANVPAGWLAAHNIAFESAPSVADHYAFGRPGWWDESVHGPWWGGLSPDEDLQGAQSHGDLDADGLQDSDRGDGFEDPMPAANRANALRPIDWTQYAGMLDLSAPPATADPVDEALPTLVRRLLAQSYVNPRIVGPTAIHRPATGSPPQQVQACLDVDGLVDAAGTATTSLFKGTTAFLLGRVTNCQGAGHHGVTVEVRGGNPPHVFGVDFTASDGAFRIPVNLKSDQGAELPADVPVVLRSRTTGTVNWTADASILSPGANRFFTVRSYASPDTAPYTNVRPALASAAGSFAAAIRSESKLTISAPDTIITGGNFDVTFRLTDGSGSPLRDPVRFTWRGTETSPLIPDQNGEGKLTFSAPNGQWGPHDLAGRSVPPASQSAFITPALETRTVNLLRPVDVLITSSPDAVDAGESILVQGRVVFQGRGIGSASVFVNLTRGAQVIETRATQTLGDGSFTAALLVPVSAQRGEYNILAAVPATTSSVHVETSAVMAVRSVPRFVAVSLGDLRQGERIHIGGQLIEPEGGGIPGAHVELTLGPDSHEVVTDGSGRFGLELDTILPSVPVIQTMRFEGDDEHASAEHRSERLVKGISLIHIGPGRIARGEPASIDVSLEDAALDPIAGAQIKIRWGDEPVVTVLTKDDGTARYVRPGNVTDPLGPVVVRAEFLGTSDRSIAGSRQTTSWIVVALAEFRLPLGPFEAGEPIPRAFLRDRGTGSPLAGQPVTLTTPGKEPVTLRTEEDGSFIVLKTPNATDIPLEFPYSLRFPGNDVHVALEETGRILVRDRTSTSVQAPTILVIGQPAVATVTVVDAANHTLPDGLVIATLDGLEVGRGSIVNGTSRLTLLVPAAQETGERVVTFEYAGNDTFADSRVTATAHVLERAVLSTTIRPGLPGATSVIEVVAMRGDRPVVDAPIFLQIEGVEGGVTRYTNESGVAAFDFLQPEDAALASIRYAGAHGATAAHSLVLIVPKPVPTLLERSARVISWVAPVIALMAAVLFYVAGRWRRSPLEPILRRARKALRGRGPDAQQILLAYQALEEAAIGFGFLPDVAPTPRMLQEAMQPRIPTSVAPALEELVSLFELARYSTELIGRLQRDQARVCLNDILVAVRDAAAVEWSNKGASRPVSAA